ncbi:MAG: cytochrome ubiquinol oxidase subunit I [candidate division KSB1 bacterium]|nr:cytochrome ubiquinol oxidase subunit I [candidate division KSB1 bacterium]
MNAVLLARLQFALAVGFHFFFPPLTFGLSLAILIAEAIHLRHKDQVARVVVDFLVRLLGLVFVLGTATGITLEFSFGTNWSQYSRFVGDVFGAPLAAEGVFAFFLESVFLGVLVFGRNRVPARAYWWAAFLVFFGAHLSGLWIIIANSWMQTPAGFEVQGGRAVLTDFWAAALNPSTLIRYVHTVAAGWITGSLFVAAVGAYYLLRRRHEHEARLMLRVALPIFIVVSFGQVLLGHQHSVQVAHTQPEKLAAFEALWEGQSNAPLALFGVPVSAHKKTYLYVGIPGLLSWLVHGDSSARIPGLEDFAVGERPPVFLPFVSYHIMIGLGFWFVAMALAALVLMAQRRVYGARWFLWALLVSAPLPHLANQFGWIAAEVGRQPWVVYRILRTADAASVVVGAGHVLVSLLGFIVIYLLLFVVFVRILARLVAEGPRGEHFPGGAGRGE